MSKLSKKWAGIIAGIVLLVTGAFGAYTAMAHPPQPETGVRAFQGAVTVSLSAVDDNSGVKYTSIAVYYRASITDVWTTLLAPTNYTGNLTYTTQGRYQVHYYSVDNLNNIEAEKVQTFLIWQDMVAPVTTITLTGNEIIPT